MHHAQFKFPTIKDADIPMGNEVQLNNWLKGIDDWKWCKVVKSPSSMIFHVKKLYGDDLWEIKDRSRRIADKMALLYEQTWGVVLGRPTMMGEPDFVVLSDDKVWQEFKKYVTVETKYAKIDKTPKVGSEFKSVESAINYADMGDNIVNLTNAFNHFAKDTRKDYSEMRDVLLEVKDSLIKFFETQQYTPPKDDRKDVI